MLTTPWPVTLIRSYKYLELWIPKVWCPLDMCNTDFSSTHSFKLLFQARTLSYQKHSWHTNAGAF